MKKKTQSIEPKQVRLLFLLLIVLIIFGCYRFGYVPIQEKTEKLKEENKSLQIRSDELNALVKREQEFDTQIAQSKEKQKKVFDQYGVGNTPEKSIEFIIGLEKEADMKISSLTFSEEETVFHCEHVPTKANTGLYLLHNPLALNYICSYDGLKRCIDYIHRNKEYMDISNITAAFDGETGMLSGTLVIDQYAITGTDRLYVPPQTGSVPIGKTNIFGGNE